MRDEPTHTVVSYSRHGNIIYCHSDRQRTQMFSFMQPFVGMDCNEVPSTILHYNKKHVLIKTLHDHEMRVIPESSIAIPIKVLDRFPNITVQICYAETENEHPGMIVNIKLLYNNKPFWCDEFASYVECSIHRPVVFKHFNEHNELHHITKPAEYILADSIYYFLYVNHYKIDQVHNESAVNMNESYNSLIASYYLNHAVWETCCVEHLYKYAHNGIIIPTQLIKDEIIDLGNFNHQTDSFTIEMAKGI